MAKPTYFHFFFFLLAVVEIVNGQDASCGVPVIDPIINGSQRMIMKVRGGNEAVAGSWPWQVRIGIRSFNSMGFMCGGSIIDERHILSAAHCFEGVLGSFQKYFVRVGDHSTKILEVGQKDYDVLKVNNHPLFSKLPSGVKNDISILKLSKPIVFSATVSPICLPDQGSDAIGDRVCLVTGWGSTVNQVTGKAKSSFLSTLLQRDEDKASLQQPIIKASDVLKQALLPVLERSFCQQIWSPVNISDSMICTASELLDREPCQGDSGGPLVCQDLGNPSRYVQEGVVSFGAGCGQNGPAVFTRMGHFRDWVKSITDPVATTPN